MKGLEKLCCIQLLKHNKATNPVERSTLLKAAVETAVEAELHGSDESDKITNRFFTFFCNEWSFRQVVREALDDYDGLSHTPKDVFVKYQVQEILWARVEDLDLRFGRFFLDNCDWELIVDRVIEISGVNLKK